MIINERHDAERLLLTQPTPEEFALFQFYKDNPDLACMDLLNQDLAPFQRKIIRGVMTHSYVLSVLSRGSGKTRMMAMCAAIECMFNPKKRVGFLGPQFRTAKLAFSEFEAILSESQDLQASVKRVSKQTDTWSVEFHNGAFIFALPLAADSEMSIRGIRLHTALIDEYPHVPKEVLDLVITPMLATQRNPMANVRRIEKEKALIQQGLMTEEDRGKNEQNKVCGFSSAYFQYNHMYKTICNYREIAKEQLKTLGKTDYGVYVFNYKDAPEGFFDMKMIEHAKANASSVGFEMEYLSYFPPDSDGFFKRSLLDSCVSRQPNEFYLEAQAKPDGIYFMGVDPARDRDNFAISIVKMVGNELRLVRCTALHDTPLPDAAQYIRKLVKDYNVKFIGMDKGGGGSAVRDFLENPVTADNVKDLILDMEDENTIGKKGRRILKLIPFSSSWISEANHEMRASFEHRQLTLPAIYESNTYIRPEGADSDLADQMALDYFALLNELQSIIMTATKTGVLHFDTPNPHMKKDRYTSLLIAHKVAYDYLVGSYQPKELADGGVLGPGGLIGAEGSEEVNWNMTKIIDDLENARKSRGRNDVSGGALTQ